MLKMFNMNRASPRDLKSPLSRKLRPSQEEEEKFGDLSSCCGVDYTA